MSEVKAVRRAVARLRLDDEAVAIPRIGHRDLHDFWPLLAEAFRPVLLAPHHRGDEDALTWTWREPGEGAAPSASVLASIREQLQRSLENFAGAVASGRMKRGSGAPWLAGGAEQVEAVMGEVVRGLVRRSDPELAGYVCRTEHGWRVHSWGAARPARPTFPDTHGLEISGRVLVAGQPARHDVVLESGDGETIAEVPSDEDGEFVFSRLSPGEYRLRARSVRGTFPPHGLAVDLQRRSVKGLVLADARADAVSPLVSARRERARRVHPATPWIVAALVAAAGGGWYAWHASGAAADETRVSASTAVPVAATTSGVVVPVAAESADALTRSAVTAQAGSALMASARDPVSPPALRRELAVEGPDSDPPVPLPEGAGAGSAPTGTRPPAAGAAGGAAPGQPEKAVADVAAAAAAQAQATSAAGGSVPPGSPAAPAPTSPPVPSAPAPLPAPAAATASAQGGATASAGDPAPAVIASATASHAAAPVAPDPAPPVSAPAASASARTLAAGVVAAEADEVTREADAARPAVAAAVVVAVTPGARTPETSAPPPVVETPAPATEVRSSVVPARSAPVAPTLAAAAPLTRTIRVRAGTWRSRLLVDTILPTAPVPLAAPESLATLRARLLAEQEARLPQALREPAARWGVALELGATAATAGLHWRPGPGARPEAANVTGSRAELLWASAADSAEREFQLLRRDGALVADVRVAANGRDFTVRTTEETATWLRLAVAAPAGAAEAPAYAWRTATAETLPPGWREADEPGTWLAEAPLGAQRGAAALQNCALFDPASGWAIVMDLRQAADRPLGL